MTVFAAIDLGASSGRVVRGEVVPGGGASTGPDRIEMTVVHRFANGPVSRDGALRWDMGRLTEEVLTGLAALAQQGPVAGIGIDTWAVDYSLLDAQGQLLADPLCYRDARHFQGVAKVHERLSPQRLYAIAGLQHLPFNTIFQLAADPLPPRAQSLLLIPDLLAFTLTGARVSELTNASTTGLLDARTRDWSGELTSAVGVSGLLAPVVAPGEVIGTLLPHIAERTGLAPGTPVYAVGSHDTASAVAGVPAAATGFAYISCGTWSLVGTEVAVPVLTEASRQAGFTNEIGIDGTTRYLRNVMGLWVLSETLRVWDEQGLPADLQELLAQAEQASPVEGPARTIVDVDDPAFLPPAEWEDDMPGRLLAAARAAGQPAPGTPAQVVRCILDSLAHAYAQAIGDVQRLTGQRLDVIHLVGGGSRNGLLCRLAAHATGLPVVAGPEESTAMGNLLVQARAAGALGPQMSLAGLRRVAAASSHTRRCDP